MTIIPIPPTDEEDATQASTTRAKSPMNTYMHKIAEIECLNRCIELEHAHMNIYHAQMQLSIRNSGNILHSNKHSFNMFNIIINRKI